MLILCRNEYECDERVSLKASRKLMVNHMFLL